MHVLQDTQVLTYRSLTEEDIPQMFRTFQEAFSDYIIPFQFTKEAFVDKFINRLNISFELSVGVFDDDRMVGFIFNTVEDYDGLKTVYNGGTGVIPAYRGQRLTNGMYDFIIPKLRKEGVQQAVLEVICSNEKAIKAYQYSGFDKSKLFRCFRMEQKSARFNAPPKGLKVQKSEVFDWRYNEMFADMCPSFADARNVLEKVMAHESIWYAHMNGKIVGYVIFQPNTGRLAQMAVAKHFRRMGIGKALLAVMYEQSINKHLTVINVNDRSKGFHSFMLDAGFKNSLNQYEMILAL